MMDKIRVKICGLSRKKDIQTADSFGADYAGFVFYEKSKRYITDDAALSLRTFMKEAGMTLPVVGVFVDAPIRRVGKLYEKGIIDIAQLHGSEDNTYIRELKEETGGGLLLWKAFVVRSGEDIAAANASVADMVLLDNGMGTGETFDWQLLGAIKRPFFLAGGLHPENVRAAINRIRALPAASYLTGVDVSSGVETADEKDDQKIKAFLMNAKGANKA